ncbi:unnamed protein product [Brassica oleracea var. botrytis]
MHVAMSEKRRADRKIKEDDWCLLYSIIDIQNRFVA